MHLRIQKNSVLTKLRRSLKQNPAMKSGLSLRQRYKNLKAANRSLKVGNNSFRTRNRELVARNAELEDQNRGWQAASHRLQRDICFWKLMNTSAALFNELAVPEEDRVSPNHVDDLRSKAKYERDSMGLPNEIMHMICGYLSFFDVRSLRNVCKETRARVPAPSGAARVSDYILPFFGDAGRFRSRCLAYYDCVIAGIVPFLSLAGLPIAPSDILDLFVTHMDAAALCNALEKQGCKFYVCPTGVVSASLLLSSLLQGAVEEQLSRASKLAATARNGGDIDPVLASLTASTPEHRWIKVHVLKPQRPIRDVVYAMPSSAYLNFVCYNEIYSYALPMTFFHGIHVPFGRQRTLSPVQWPPRLQLRSVGREVLDDTPPSECFPGRLMGDRLWVKSWNGDKPKRLRSDDFKEGAPYAGAVFEVIELGVDGGMSNMAEVTLGSRSEFRGGEAKGSIDVGILPCDK
ncbi:hypothetical protein ONZ45_g18459 [Pleurotus djamor]|nr:hypothetical protein ONZ45_g18459 [Pleurotus djamor]